MSVLVSTTQFQVKDREIKPYQSQEDLEEGCMHFTGVFSLSLLAGKVGKNCFHAYVKVPFSARNPSTLLLSGIIHQDSDTRVPSPGGWLYLSRDRVWMEDPGIKVTGIRNIQEDGVRMACPPEIDTDYPGHDLQSLTSPDLATCVRMCKTRGTCRGVTWTRDTCQMKFRIVLS